MPDIVGRVRFDFPRGHLTTSGFVGAASFRSAVEDAGGNTDRDTVTLWGTMASVKFIPFGKRLRLWRGYLRRRHRPVPWRH